MASQSTCSPEAQHHQSALKPSTADFIKLMKDEDEHNVKHYGSYIADIKLLSNTYITDLATHETKDVEKQIIETVKVQAASTSVHKSQRLRVPMKIFWKVLQDLSMNKS